MTLGVELHLLSSRELGKRLLGLLGKIFDILICISIFTDSTSIYELSVASPVLFWTLGVRS